MPAAGEDAAGGAVPGHHLQPPAVLRRGAVPADEREETHLDVPRVRPRGALRPPHHRRVSVTPRPPPDPTPHAPRRAGAAPPEPPQPCSPGRLFMEILNSCTDCDEIEFMEDGSWCPMRHRKEKRELCGAADLGGSGGLGWGGMRQSHCLAPRGSSTCCSDLSSHSGQGLHAACRALSPSRASAEHYRRAEEQELCEKYN